MLDVGAQISHKAGQRREFSLPARTYRPYITFFFGASTKMSEPDSLWFVIYCEIDDSHSLISDDGVIYDEDNVQVDDDVRFSYPGCKDL